MARAPTASNGTPFAFADSPRSASIASLAYLYVVWGSTYLAMRVALASFPPLTMVALRCLLSGGLLYVWLRLRGAPTPTRGEWARSVLVGFLFLTCGLGGVALALGAASSGVAALVLGSVPLWATLFGRAFFGERIAKRECAGIFLGFSGIALVAIRGTLSADPRALFVLVGGTAAYALGTVLARHFTLPRGAMSTATQMLGGGAALTVASIAHGEQLPSSVSSGAIAALLYLVFFGSILGYCAFNFLMRTSRPAVATSYAYVNPIVALGLGATFGGERVGPVEGLAAGLVVGAVGLVLRPKVPVRGRPSVSAPVPLPVPAALAPERDRARARARLRGRGCLS